MMQYWRCIRLLVGEDTIRTLQANSTKPMPSSNPQCVKYFHDMLGYKVVARSVKTGGPSLDEKSMYKLALRQNNPVIDFILKYRQTQKETSAMKFIPLHPFETQIKRIGELSKV
jgi:DNA polymerase I-like protein with 3'-5' exonuclease and polymerase domains